MLVLNDIDMGIVISNRMTVLGLLNRSERSGAKRTN